MSNTPLDKQKLTEMYKASGTALDDLVSLHKKATEMYKAPDKQSAAGVIKLQMDTLDALVRLATKFKAWL